jgi:hypothetical protein
MNVGVTNSVAMADEEQGRKCYCCKWCYSLWWSWASRTRRLLLAQHVTSRCRPRLAIGKPPKSREMPRPSSPTRLSISDALQSTNFLQILPRSSVVQHTSQCTFTILQLKILITKSCQYLQVEDLSRY